MTLQDLKKHIETAQYKPMIKCYADSNHYLAGAENSEGDFFSMNLNGKNMTFNSIKEAETALAKLGAQCAIIEMQTAYDEMVGISSGGCTRYTVNL